MKSKVYAIVHILWYLSFKKVKNKDVCVKKLLTIKLIFLKKVRPKTWLLAISNIKLLL